MPKITTTDHGYILETNFKTAGNIFMLFDANGDFIEKSQDYNFLHKKLLEMAKTPQEPEAPKTPLYYYRGAMFILN